MIELYRRPPLLRGTRMHYNRQSFHLRTTPALIVPDPTTISTHACDSDYQNADMRESMLGVREEGR